MTGSPAVPPQLARVGSVLLPLEGQPPGVLDDSFGLRLSAVLVLLVPRQDRYSFLLTERPDTLARHAGQVSLPGGAMDRADRSLWDTAVRETDEELGVPPELVRPLGRLEPVPVAVSRYLIVPFVGFTQAPPVLRPDPAEVSRVVEVPLDDVTERRRLVTEPWKLRGSSWRVTYYRFGDTVVWGATARVLGHLAARLDPRFSDVDPAPGDVTPA